MRHVLVLAAAASVWSWTDAFPQNGQQPAGVRLRDQNGDWLVDARAAAFIDGERFVVLSGRTDVLAYESQLTTPKLIGRRGRGPGEFELVMSVSAGGDGSIQVLDAATGAVSTFRFDGTHLSTASLAPGSRCCTRIALGLLREATRSGSVQSYQVAEYRIVNLRSGRAVPSTARLSLRERAPEYMRLVARQGPGFSFGRPAALPWIPQPMTALAPDFLYHGTGTASSVDAIDYATGRTRSVPTGIASTPHSSGMRRRLREEFLQAIADPDARRDVAALIPIDSVPSHSPFYDRALADVREGVWLRTASQIDDRHEWRRYSVRAGLSERCAVPRDWTVLAFGEVTAVVSRDDPRTDETVVELHRKEELCGG